MEYDRKRMLRDIQPIQTLSTAMATSAASGDELVADTDEPPDEKLGTPRPRSHQRLPTQEGFGKSTLPPPDRKQSLLTQALHTSDSENTPEAEFGGITQIPREMSTASLQSNTSAGSMAELTSDGGFTSPGTRNNSPSPPLPPASFRGLPPIFNKPGFEHPVTIHAEDDHIGPFQKTQTTIPSEGAVEAGLGRKRCISFACGRTSTPTPAAANPPKVVETQTTEVKRPCTIRFACPNKVSTEKPSRSMKPQLARQRSPAPKLLKAADSSVSMRSHRDSDSTLRNPSPLARRKLSGLLRPRRDSNDSDVEPSEATRFHAFASSKEEVDEWVQESGCHRQRLTISDTLKVENKLRQLGEEAEEEAIEEENDDDDEDDEDEDEEDEDEDEDGDDDIDDAEEDGLDTDGRLYEDESSDDGFKTDDEDGFAGSDDDSDAGSDYAWWSPRRSDDVASTAQPEHIRAKTRRSFSESSVGSAGNSSSIRHQRLPPTGEKRLRKPKPLNIRPQSPELPDSTDFVCGTLDEDRPLEDAYMSALEARRIAKHRFTPQDIDPTFPTSDPEMDEEDEDEQLNEESDQHLMMVGSLEATDGELRGRHQRPKARYSPPPSAKRMKSPPPRRLFDSPPKRLRSPPPARRLRSPPPTRRQSFARSPQLANEGYFISLAQRPELTVATSLPRTPLVTGLPHISDDDEETSKEQVPSRGAIEIKAGLERKRKRRQEKLYQKHCRKEAQREKDKRFRPGIGCQKMRQIGLDAISRKRQEVPFPPTKEAMILSF